MKITAILLSIFLTCSFLILQAADFTIYSPDKRIIVQVSNNEKLSYKIEFNGKPIINESRLGFELKNEPPMGKGLIVNGSRQHSVNENWEPVVKSKHALISNNYNELILELSEKDLPKRSMELFFRVYDDGVALRYKLFRNEKITERKITGELTGFVIPGNPKAWVVEYGRYNTSNEAEFFERPLSYVNEKSIAGLPFLMEYSENCWVALAEADIENYPAYYIGTDGQSNSLITKLSPLPGEDENGIKASFRDDIYTPWRVLMIGDNPGRLIESEIIQNLNDPCAIKDPSWIKPGLSAWDHWWSGEVKMEMPVIKQYIDLASEMGWPYMLVDWQWYGKFNTPEADITKWAPQIDMPEIIRYAGSKNVKIILWLYSSDVNRNSMYKKAFPLYRKWGIVGVKIDFMDRDDQIMVNWYHDIIKFAAENQLLVDFHGAYRPDGIIRTYPNMITREGVMGNEYYKFSDKMSPEHNVKLAFTRMLAGQMDYTPGAFLNVTREKFKQQTPALVWNTRAAELSKFIIYESPLTVVCDHPDNILNKPGSELLKIVPTTWDDIKFLSGYPGDHVALAKSKNKEWFTGVMNNSKEKDIEIVFDFLPPGMHEIEIWADAKDSNTEPMKVDYSRKKIRSGEKIKIHLAKNGGWVAHIK